MIRGEGKVKGKDGRREWRRRDDGKGRNWDTQRGAEGIIIDRLAKGNRLSGIIKI